MWLYNNLLYCILQSHGLLFRATVFIDFGSEYDDMTQKFTTVCCNLNGTWEIFWHMPRNLYIYLILMIN